MKKLFIIGMALVCIIATASIGLNEIHEAELTNEEIVESLVLERYGEGYEAEIRYYDEEEDWLYFTVYENGNARYLSSIRRSFYANCMNS